MLAEGRYKAVDSQSSSSPRSTASQPRGVLLPCLGVITEHQWVTFLQADVVASTADQEKLKQHDGKNSECFVIRYFITKVYVMHLVHSRYYFSKAIGLLCQT